MWGYFRGIGFAFLVFYSSYFGTIFLLTPILPFIYIAPKQAKAVLDAIITLWKIYFTVRGNLVNLNFSKWSLIWLLAEAVFVLFCFPVTPINQFLIILGRCTLYTLVCLQDEPTCMRIEPV